MSRKMSALERSAAVPLHALARSRSSPARRLAPRRHRPSMQATLYTQSAPTDRGISTHVVAMPGADAPRLRRYASAPLRIRAGHRSFKRRPRRMLACRPRASCRARAFSVARPSRVNCRSEGQADGKHLGTVMFGTDPHRAARPFPAWLSRYGRPKIRKISRK